MAMPLAFKDEVKTMVLLVLHGPPEGPERAEWRDEQRRAVQVGDPSTDPLYYLRQAAVYLDEGLFGPAVRAYQQWRSEQSSWLVTAASRPGETGGAASVALEG